MSDAKLSRAYLETLPSADLLALADEFGIDIPENLNRRFIIGELLEVSGEFSHDDRGDDLEETSELQSSELFEPYNETAIAAVVRNPVWLFVYWDLRSDLMETIQSSDKTDSLVLRVSMFSKEEPDVIGDSFALPISLTDRNRYVLLPCGYGFVCVDLVMDLEAGGQNMLATTGLKRLPSVPEYISNPLSEIPVSPVLRLSGFSDLLHTHYMNHRQSFS